jgi:hypothetical protein
MVKSCDEILLASSLVSRIVIGQGKFLGEKVAKLAPNSASLKDKMNDQTAQLHAVFQVGLSISGSLLCRILVSMECVPAFTSADLHARLRHDQRDIFCITCSG